MFLRKKYRLRNFLLLGFFGSVAFLGILTFNLRTSEDEVPLLAQMSGRTTVSVPIRGEVYGWLSNSSFNANLRYDSVRGIFVLSIVGVPIVFDVTRGGELNMPISVGGVEVIVSIQYHENETVDFGMSWTGNGTGNVRFSFNLADLQGISKGDAYVRGGNSWYSRLTFDGPSKMIMFMADSSGTYRVDIVKDSKTGKLTKACITSPGGTKVCSNTDPAGFCRLLAQLLGKADKAKDTKGKAKLKELQDLLCGGGYKPTGGVPPSGRSPENKF